MELKRIKKKRKEKKKTGEETKIKTNVPQNAKNKKKQCTYINTNERMRTNDRILIKK